MADSRSNSKSNMHGKRSRGNSFFSSGSDQVLRLPFLPPNIEFEDLNKYEGFLIDPQTRKQLQEAELEENVLHSKKILREKYGIETKYSIVRLAGKNYAIYPIELGKGGFGKVSVLQHLTSQKFYVLKKQFIDMHPDLKAALAEENVKAMEERAEATRSQRLAAAESEQKTLNELGKSPRTPLKTRVSPSKNREQYSIVMELEEGEDLAVWYDNELQKGLYKTYLTSPMMSGGERIQTAIDLLLAAQEFLATGRIHGDLKLENFLRSPDGVITLIDYGTAVAIDEHKKATLSQPIGTWPYLAPELRDELRKHIAKEPCQCVYSEKTEVYALGICLAMLFGLYAKPAVDEKIHNREDIGNDSYVAFDEEDDFFAVNEVLPLTPVNLRKDILDLIIKMTDDSAEARPAFDDIIKELRKIKENYYNLPPETPGIKLASKVAVFDLNEFLSQDAYTGDERQKIIAALKKADEVMIIDTGGKVRTQFDYLEFRYWLECNEIKVNGSLIISETRQEADEAVTRILVTAKLPSQRIEFELKDVLDTPAPGAANLKL